MLRTELRQHITRCTDKVSEKGTDVFIVDNEMYALVLKPYINHLPGECVRRCHDIKWT